MIVEKNDIIMCNNFNYYVVDIRKLDNTDYYFCVEVDENEQPLMNKPRIIYQKGSKFFNLKNNDVIRKLLKSVC